MGSEPPSPRTSLFTDVWYPGIVMTAYGSALSRMEPGFSPVAFTSWPCKTPTIFLIAVVEECPASGLECAAAFAALLGPTSLGGADGDTTCSGWEAQLPMLGVQPAERDGMD